MPKSIAELTQHLDDLRRLYEVERLTLRKIGARYDTSKNQIACVFRRNGVHIRSTYESIWGITREDRAPTKEQLEQHLADGLTSYDIAQIYGCDHTAIPYWIKRYGIDWTGYSWTQRHRSKGFVEPTAQELFVMYCIDFLSTDEIARKLKCSKGLVSERLTKYGIELRPSGWTGKMFKCVNGQLVKSTYEQRVGNWLCEHQIAFEYEPQLPFDRTCKADFLAQDKYIEIWGVLDNQSYEKRKKHKIEQYQLHNLPLIQINSWDFCAQKKDAWQKRLAKYLLVNNGIA